MKISLAQISPKLSPNNIALHEKYIQQAISKKYSIIAFPELSLNGYYLQDAVKEDYFTLEKFDIFSKYSKDIDIVLGAVVREENKYFNSALYLSNGKILHIHHKNILPTYGMFEESRFFDKGNDVKAFNTKYGNMALCICEDLWDESFVENIKSLNLECLFVLAASPSRGFKDAGLTIQEDWKEILENCVNNETKVIFINRVGFEDGLGFWGGSCIVQSQKIIKQAPLFKEGLY